MSGIFFVWVYFFAEFKILALANIKTSKIPFKKKTKNIFCVKSKLFSKLVSNIENEKSIKLHEMKNKQLFAVYYWWYARNKKTSTTGIFIHSDTLTESGQIFIFMQISSNGKIMSLALNICLNCEFVVCVCVCAN